MDDFLIDLSVEEPLPSGSSSKHSSLLDRINASRNLNGECYKALEELIEENETLMVENVSLKAQLSDTSEDTGNGFHQRPEASPQQLQIESLEHQLKAARLSMETAPFVLVLIDGNAHTFVDSLFQRGSLGGADAGLILRDQIADKIYQYVAAEDWEIVTKLYVDFENLLNKTTGRTCSETGLRKFFAGFTQVQSTFEAVDTGPGVDEANLKIREMLHLFAGNVQCKHIFYACGPDAPSLSALDTYRNNFIVSSSITLIKSKAFEDADIYLPFEVMEIPSLFQEDGEEIQNNSVSKPERKTSPKRHERSRTRTTPSRKRQSVSSTVNESTWGPETKTILLNIDNQRVDSQLDKLDPLAVDSFKKRTGKKKVCVWYHIDGRCINGSACTYGHGHRLSTGEVEVLRFKTRENLCEYGSKCRNPRCHYGHMCPQVHCTRGNLCKFRHFHGISRDAIKIYDGSNDYEVTDAGMVAEMSTDSSGEVSKKLNGIPAIVDINGEGLGGIEAISKKEVLGGMQAMLDNAFNFHIPSTVLAPRNPNIPETQDKRKIEEEEEAAEEPYKRYFTRSKGVQAHSIVNPTSNQVSIMQSSHSP